MTAEIDDIKPATRGRVERLLADLDLLKVSSRRTRPAAGRAEEAIRAAPERS